MKEIKAYIKPFMLQKVTDALREIHIRGMSVSDTKGFGKQKDESYLDSSHDLFDFIPKSKIEIVCSDQEVKKIVEVIQKNAHTGRFGDGKIFISTVDEVVSIRTGKKDEEAL